MEGLGEEAEAQGEAEVGGRETEAAEEEGAESEEHAVRKWVCEGMQGSDAGCKRKKQ